MTPALVAAFAALGAGAGAIAVLAKGTRPMTEAPPALPLALRAAVARTFAWAELLPPAFGSGRIGRHLHRQLARAGLLGPLESRHWLVTLAALALGGALVALLIVAWSGAVMPWVALPCATLPPWLAQGWLARLAEARARELERGLPAAIDLLVLCLESGASLGTALRIAHEKSAAGALRDLFGAILLRIRSGQDRALALRRVRDDFDLPGPTGLLTALIQAETRGMSLGPPLRAQSAQSIAERFVRAERAAMQAPVKLLLPLLLFIFPCTFVVIAVPIAARLAGLGDP